jgi:hypothetical protein
MAINFLDNVQFNQNQLLGARLQVETLDSNVSAPVSGQMIYNSTTNKFKYYNGSDWIDPAAGSYTKWVYSQGSSFNIDDGDTLALNNDSSFPGVQIGTSSSGTTVTSLLRFYPKDISTTTGISDYTGDFLIYQDTSDGFKAKKTLTGNIPLDKFGDAEADVDMGGFKILDVATPTASTDAANKAYVDASATNTTYTLPVTSGTNSAVLTLTGSDSSTDAVTINGTTNEVSVVANNAASLTVGLPDDVTIAGELTVSGTSQSSFGGQVTIPTTPVATTDAASKAYVDSSVAGGLNVKGGFNANTGAIVSGGNLTSGAGRVAIAVGDYYVVTVAGDFFGNAATPLTPGDSVLVQTAAASGASVEGDFAVIQSDTDLATETTVGIGNVEASTTNSKLGVSVSYSNGTASVGWSIKSLNLISNAIVDADRMAILDNTNNDQKSVALSTLKTFFQSGLSQGFAATSSSGTTHTFNHNLNTLDVIVQVYDASTNETVYASVDRTSVNQVVVTTAASANIRCLINNVG